MSVQTVKNNKIIVGLTGGVASGKTTASNYIRSLGVPLIDSDEIVDGLWQNDLDMIEEIHDQLGIKVETKDDRKRLAKLVFDNPDKRLILNGIVHPRVYSKIDDMLDYYSEYPLVVIDMPLLIETGYVERCDYVILIYVDYQTQLSRLIKRDNLTEVDAMKRILSQDSLDYKKNFADFIIENDGSIQELYDNLDEVLRGITR